MAENDNPSPQDAIEDLKSRAADAKKNVFTDIDTDPALRIQALESISAYRAWFAIHIISPFIHPISPPLVHQPDSLEDVEQQAEFVYLIHDSGDVLATSKAQEMFTAGYSMCKLYYTIEKMIWLLIERLNSGGVDTEEEVQIAIHGHSSALRYAFGSIINLQSNVVIINYDPGSWGEDYLEVVNRMAEKGYGYPSESPRDIFRKSHGTPKPSSS